MKRPDPQHAVVALASFLRRRLSEVGSLLPLRRFAKQQPPAQLELVRQQREVAALIVAASEPFATTSFARARLLRQLHAAGLLSQDEADRAAELFEIAQ
jgi:hypothetical protein